MLTGDVYLHRSTADLSTDPLPDAVRNQAPRAHETVISTTVDPQMDGMHCTSPSPLLTRSARVRQRRLAPGQAASRPSPFKRSNCLRWTRNMKRGNEKLLHSNGQIISRESSDLRARHRGLIRARRQSPRRARERERARIYTRIAISPFIKTPAALSLLLLPRLPLLLHENITAKLKS